VSENVQTFGTFLLHWGFGLLILLALSMSAITGQSATLKKEITGENHHVHYYEKKKMILKKVAENAQKNNKHYST
jgi:hypothetical protein